MNYGSVGTRTRLVKASGTEDGRQRDPLISTLLPLRFQLLSILNYFGYEPFCFRYGHYGGTWLNKRGINLAFRAADTINYTTTPRRTCTRSRKKLTTPSTLHDFLLPLPVGQCIRGVVGFQLVLLFIARNRSMFSSTRWE